MTFIETILCKWFYFLKCKGSNIFADFVFNSTKETFLTNEILSRFPRSGKSAGNVGEVPLKNNSIGAVVSAGTFTHGHVGPNAFDELLRITKPGGLFVISINSKVFIKDGFQKKFLKIKNKISSPIFDKFKVHGDHKDKKLSAIKVYAVIFRKKS